MVDVHSLFPEARQRSGSFFQFALYLIISRPKLNDSKYFLVQFVQLSENLILTGIDFVDVDDTAPMIRFFNDRKSIGFKIGSQ